MYNDQSIKVRSAISWFFFKICENYADLITQTDESTKNFILVLLLKLKDTPKISKNAALTLDNLAKSLAPSDPQQQSNKITPYLEEIVKALFVNKDREKDRNNNLM